jgi:glycosyltransferase involved in cell wall biosynthesis
MKTKSPKVSIIMGAYNTEAYMRKAIQSILKQTYENFEFIIIDDCCTDGTMAIVQEYKDPRIIIVRNEKNIGLTKSLNIGLAKAKGEYIARMDADDIAMPDRIEEQVQFLQTHPDIGVVGTWADIIDPKDNVIGEIKYATDDATIRKNMVARNQFIHPSTMYRRIAIEATGPYSEEFKTAQDYEFCARMLTNIPKKLMLYRWDFKHSMGFTSGKRQETDALRARKLMITKYGWPKTDARHMIRPLVTYLIPMSVKKAILKAMRRI